MDIIDYDFLIWDSGQKLENTLFMMSQFYLKYSDKHKITFPTIVNTEAWLSKTKSSDRINVLVQ